MSGIPYYAEQGHECAQGASVRTHEQAFDGFGTQPIDKALQAFAEVFGRFSIGQGGFKIAHFPLIDHPFVHFQAFGRTFLAFVVAPTDFIDIGIFDGGNAHFNKRRHCLLAAFEGRMYHQLKIQFAVSFEKRFCLFAACIIQVGIHATSLHDSEAIVFRFAVPQHINGHVVLVV